VITTRDQIIETTCGLLEAQGYHATGLNQIVKESDTPKGSLYHYFPGGKDELTAEAVARNAMMVEERIRAQLAAEADAARAVQRLVRQIADAVEQSEFRAGGPLQTVALETATTHARLNGVCQEAYRLIQGAFTDRLRESGLEAEAAEALSTLITAAVEGAILLSRTHHTGEPLRLVADQLADVIRAAGAGAGTG
jgi:TetR/AcrR family transcriptional repressor of lmrAB and yxaGH operons